MSEPITYVGMDVHKNSIHVALLAPGSEKPLTWSQGTTTDAIPKLMVRVVREAEVSHGLSPHTWVA